MAFVDIRYRGEIIFEGIDLFEDKTGLFFETDQSLPIGTSLIIVQDKEEVEANVVDVMEKHRKGARDDRPSGMILRTREEHSLTLSTTSPIEREKGAEEDNQSADHKEKDIVAKSDEEQVSVKDEKIDESPKEASPSKESKAKALKKKATSGKGLKRTETLMMGSDTTAQPPKAKSKAKKAKKKKK